MITRRLRRPFITIAAATLAFTAVSSGLGIISAGASSTPGVTANSITIGASVPLSGIAASYAPVSAAANAVFQWVNKHGGVNGRKIKYIRLDDCYDLAAYGLGCTQPSSTTTLSQNQVLVAQDHVFATVGSLGTQAQESVENYLKQNGVPQLFVNSGWSGWNAAGKYPGLFGYQTSYQAEGKIFARYIKTSLSGQTVGFIGQNDNFGQNEFLGLQDGGISIAAADHLSYNAADAITGSASDIEADVVQLKTDNVQVVVLASVPGFTAGILTVAKDLGYSPHWIISSVGSDPTLVNNAGEAGAVTLDYFPAANNNGNPWIPWVRKVLLADKTDFPTFTSSTVLSGNDLYGAGYAVAFVEVLKSLGKNVTRAGFLKAMTSTSLADPAIVPLKFSRTNHQGLQGGQIFVIKANGANTPVLAEPVSSSIFTTGSDAHSKLVISKKPLITPIPSWLK